jgi:nuclear GTP-binding protein
VNLSALPKYLGYPNTGKSSVINTLISKKSCKVAPVPGETKVWQYITLMKRIYLIDCPGVVVDTAGDTEVDSVLKGVVRAERLESPEDFIDAILEQVQRKHIAAQYGLSAKAEDDQGVMWTTSLDLLEKIALKAGRLRKGGEPDIRSSAITIINDFQRGKLPHYVPPPELKKTDKSLRLDSNTANTSLLKTNITVTPQDLDAVGEEYMTNTMPEEDEEEESNLPPVSTNDSEADDQSSITPIEEDDEDDILPPVIVAGAQWEN